MPSCYSTMPCLIQWVSFHDVYFPAEKDHYFRFTQATVSTRASAQSGSQGQGAMRRTYSGAVGVKL